ncbi:hypothetical protein CPARA_1gp165 (nucleomorph) [Cryptomonas paramecium]|uniref:Uncharacterized protein n=1 Tax=Cryptomonas paramaecium TaxID=2898 RepID=F2HHM7_9CRYP|nr:hypothetical protein CPARA_1gp165 [Cryptomonas paramecium]AEA38823.1 hypothetical protein CPARA_1gp165 [Cryptomonas paramecium]
MELQKVDLGYVYSIEYVVVENYKKIHSNIKNKYLFILECLKIFFYYNLLKLMNLFVQMFWILYI